MNRPPLWKIILTILFVAFGFTIILSVAFLINSSIYQWADVHPSDFIKLITTNILGFVLFFCTMFIISKFTTDKRSAFYQQILDALRKVSHGDFNVYLDMKIDKNHPLTTIVDHINHMAKQLKKMEDLRQEFIANVSHEIQSPLTSISGFARVLMDGELCKEDQHHYLGIIEEESSRLSKLSDNLLKLTSLESEHHPFERKEYRLDKQIRKIILSCEPQWAKKDIDMDVSLEPITYFADEDLLSQVWNNLIHNGIKFTPRGGKIQIQLFKRADQVEINFSDSGAGISEEDQVHIFERFYKADKARNRTNGGSGLGLSIAKKIVDMHDGTISVKSQLDNGTTFTVLLHGESPSIH